MYAVKFMTFVCQLYLIKFNSTVNGLEEPGMINLKECGLLLSSGMRYFVVYHIGTNF